MKRLSTAILTVLIGTTASSPAYCNPQGAQVVHGSATFTQVNPQRLDITNSANAIINWQSFGINPNEITRFIQPSASSAVLNRVIGQDPSQIMGQLQSNGRVFLINPNGVLFGQNAVVDTAGLIASTLNMSDQDFLNGKLNFEAGPDAGAIENKGYIKAGKNGDIFLIAPNIENSGVIETDGGRLLLAAGEKISIASLDTDDIVFEIQAPENTVLNLGTMIVKGGAASVFAGTIQHSGTINADSLSVDRQGRIQLFAQADINVTDTARLSANGPEGGSIQIESDAGTTLVAGQVSATANEGQGGEIKILGNNVGLLDMSVVDASGELGGGEVLIGGDFQGNNPAVKNAEFTYMGSNAQIRADAQQSGNGGKVILWADDSTRAYGGISAIGGADSGDGGFVEISGKHGLVFEAEVSATAANGENGTLLLDPDTVDIINGGGGSGDGGLPVFTASGATTISELALEGQAIDVVVQATDGITLQDLADNTLSMTSLVSGESITLRVTGAGNINFLDSNDSITTAGGDIILAILGGAGNLSNIGNLSTSAGTAGDVTLFTSNGNIDLQGSLNLAGTTSGNASFQAGTLGIVSQAAGSIINGAKLKVIAGGGISLTNNNQVQQFTGRVQNTGNLDFTNNPGLTLAADGTIHAVETVNGDINIEVGGNITVANSISANGNARLKNNSSGIDINAALTASTVQLEAQGVGTGDGEVRQNGVGVITANLLDVIASQAVLLSSASNQVGTFTSLSNGALNSGTSLNNNTPLLTLGTITDNNGDISITNAIDILIDFDVNAVSGNVSISTGSNLDGDGSAVKVSSAGDLTLIAGTGIGISNKVITDTAADLTLTTTGSAGAGDIRVEETSGPARFNTSALFITTDGATQQLVDLSLPNGLNVNANLGSAGDNLSIHTPGRDIQEGAGTLTANQLVLDSDTGIGGVAALQTAASIITATVASGGALNLDNTGAVTFNALSNNSGGDIRVNQTGGSGAVIVAAPVNSGGQTRIRANAANLTIASNISSPGSVFLDATTTGNVIVNPSQTVNATGVGSVVDVTAGNDAQINGDLQSSLSDVNVTASSGQLIMSGTSQISAGNNATLAANTNVNLAQVNAANTVSVTSSTDSINDINGAVVNVNATTTSLTAPTNIGLFNDPLETLTPVLNLSNNSGEVGIVNAGTLQLPNGTFSSSKFLVKTTVGDLTFSPAVSFPVATQVNIEAQNNLLLQSGLTANNALLTLDSVAGILALNGVAESVSAMDVVMAAPTINVTNGASVTSLSNMNVNAGSLFIDAGAVAGNTKLTAPGTMVFRGNDITVQGGTAANAAASIDPTLVDISIAGNLNVLAGTGNSATAEILGDVVQITTPGNVNITGGGPLAFARIESLVGNVDITANNIQLTPGGGLDGDAVIAANFGAGTVNLNAASCANCLQLGANPFGNSNTEAGVFAAVLNLATPGAGSAAGDAGNELPAVDEILVLDELFKALEEELVQSPGRDEEEKDEDDSRPVLVCS